MKRDAPLSEATLVLIEHMHMTLFKQLARIFGRQDAGRMLRDLALGKVKE